jgi:uncharacterized membrane protein
MGKGGWGRTPLAEILPVTCLAHEDLMESTEGYLPRVTKTGRVALRGISFKDCPPILGYNLTRARPGTQTLMEIGEDSAPLLATRKVGAGRVLAFMSDPAPHWGCNFVFWSQYAKFWQACVDLVGPRAGALPEPSSNGHGALPASSRSRRRAGAAVA